VWKIKLSKNAGRKTTLTEEEVLDIVDAYKNEIDDKGEIKYPKIFAFANEYLSSNGYENQVSYDFWRRGDRLGRKIIDKVNRTYSELTKVQEEQFELPDLVKLLENLGLKRRENQTLFGSMEIIEKQFKKLNNELSSMKKDNETFRISCDEKEKKVNEITADNERLAKSLKHYYLILSDFNSSEVKDRIEYSMKNLFKTQSAFHEILNKYDTTNNMSNSSYTEKTTETSNVVKGRFTDAYK
jgi:hypothetical protein